MRANPNFSGNMARRGVARDDPAWPIGWNLVEQQSGDIVRRTTAMAAHTQCTALAFSNVLRT
ncbi:MAG: hypothetical protein ACREFO_15695 [Acetobacteraceae bacterium]